MAEKEKSRRNPKEHWEMQYSPFANVPYSTEEKTAEELQKSANRMKTYNPVNECDH